jgi:lipoate-protein ligase A
MDRWSLIDDGPAPGAVNMARDEFLFERAGIPGAVPSFRLYSFEPSAITIGFHQNPAAVLDLDVVRSDRMDVVRRITGGRALLHAGELTYCVVIPAGHNLSDLGLRGAFREISLAVSSAMRKLGVETIVSAGGGGMPRGSGTPCLVAPSRDEVTAGGRKIVCSAQRRAHGVLLQHGSILLEQGSEQIVKYLKGNWGDLGANVTFVSRETGYGIERDEMKLSLVKAFAERFSVRWQAAAFSDQESESIGRRAELKGREIGHAEAVL